MVFNLIQADDFILGAIYEIYSFINTISYYCVWGNVPPNAGARAPSLDGLKWWIQGQRPHEPTFKENLPKYPEWIGSCPGTADLLVGFAKEFKIECIDETYNSTIKSLGESLEVAGLYPQKVQKVIQPCFDSVGNAKGTALEVAVSLNECNKAINDIKEKAKGLHKQATEISKISSLKKLDSFTGMSETFVTTALICTLKAMLTSGDMTTRQKQDVKKNVDNLLSVPGKISAGYNIVSDLGKMAVTLAENGLEFVNSDEITDLESLLIKLDKISFYDMVKEKGNQLLDSVQFEDEKRIQELKKKGMEIVHLMNSCQVDLALEDLEIFNNMVDQEFLEQRWAITKVEKGMWCSAFEGNNKYDRMNDKQKVMFIGRRPGNTEPPPSTDSLYWPQHNPPRSTWYSQIDKHKKIINEMERVYAEFSPNKVASARKKEQRGRSLIDRLIEKANSVITNQCIDKDKDAYIKDLEITKDRLIRANESNCGKAGLGKEFQLSKFID